MGCLKISYYQEEAVLGELPIFLSKGKEKTGKRQKNGLDYYPFGSPLPNRSWTDGTFTARRNGYQGEYSETDESGLLSFELRQYDPVIGRWISPDPYNQYHSPYVGMGNRPHFMVDPDGGKAGWLRKIFGGGGNTVSNAKKFTEVLTKGLEQGAKNSDKLIMAGVSVSNSVMRNLGKQNELNGNLFENPNGGCNNCPNPWDKGSDEFYTNLQRTAAVEALVELGFDRNQVEKDVEPNNRYMAKIHDFDKYKSKFKGGYIQSHPISTNAHRTAKLSNSQYALKVYSNGDVGLVYENDIDHFVEFLAEVFEMVGMGKVGMKHYMHELNAIGYLHKIGKLPNK